MENDDESASLPEQNVEFPPKLIFPLFQSTHRFRVFKGGRAAGKSTSILSYIAMEGTKKKMRILICREFLNAVDESVHQTISQQIASLNLGNFYRIEKTCIYGANGTEIRFLGIANNIEAIRSYESIDLAFVEEAENISEEVWRVFLPTVIRKAGSRLIISFNPGLAKSATYQRWVVKANPKTTLITTINYLDNPFISEESLELAEECKTNDPDEYLNVWLGQPIVALTNAIYGNELRKATIEGRITQVPYDATCPVDTFWDLGRNDYMSIVFGQMIAGQYRIIDFFEEQGLTAKEAMKQIEQKPYLYRCHHLPHDADAKTVAAKFSVAGQLRMLGKRIIVVPRTNIAAGINATRTVFPNLYIDESKCAKLLDHLREYKYDQNSLRKEPRHDEHSHAADALKYCALVLRPPKPEEETSNHNYDPLNPDNNSRYNRAMRKRSPTSWMGR